MTPSLQDLIAAAKAKVAATDRLKVTEAKAKTARTESARAESQAEADRLRSELDWRLVALVLVIEEWECICGEDGQDPQGVYLYKEHTRMANSTVLTPPRHESAIPAELPRRVKYTNRTVSLCPHCMAGLGFSKILTANVTLESNRPKLPPGEFVREWLERRGSAL